MAPFERRPVLYVCVTEAGAVRFRQVYHPALGDVAITHAHADEAGEMRAAVLGLLGRTRDGRMLAVPGTTRQMDLDHLVTACIAFRDAVHLYLGWTPGPRLD